MPEPITPRLEDVLPGLPAVADEKAAALTPVTRPVIVPAGQDLSTIVDDLTGGVRDVRTPPELLPMEAVLADQLSVTPNDLRLIRAYILDFGTATMWERLDAHGDVDSYVIASFVAGTARLRLVFTRRMSTAEGRLAIARAHLADMGMEALPDGR